MQQPHSRTYESLDLWRGFAAIWVVLFHSMVDRDTDFGSGRNFFVEFCSWGDTAVPIFFVISGYCMSAAAANLIDRNHTLGRFAVARIRRIYPPHIAVLLLGLTIPASYWLAQQLGYIHDNPTVTWFTHLTAGHLIINALLIQVPLNERSLNDVTWTLSYEVAFYAVIGLAIYAFRKQGWQRMLQVLHVVTIVAFLITVFAPNLSFFPFNHWIGFGEGVLLFDLLCGRPWKERSRKGKALYGAVILAIGTLIIVQIIREQGSPQSWRLLLTSLFAILFYILRPFDAYMKRSRVLSGLFFVGGFSYSLYLIHFMMLSVLHRVAVKLHFPPQLYVAETLIELAICIAIAYVFYWLVESRFMAAKAKSVVARQPVVPQIIPERV
ncbi:MAG: acyltransferase [Fibrella sp.]|nr:acyltransferase [Armatimonadota bacterium]